jgi:DNA-binding SARP family transcriptional activator/tetratricopeptide (TPR) repeat protein
MSAAGAAEVLEIRFFGEGQVHVDGVAVKAMAAARLRSLLAFLVLARDRPIGRERLAFLFWPDSTEAQARTNLRQALHHLRRALGASGACLRVDHRAVRWISEDNVEIDVVTFDEAARAGLEQGGHHTLLERAADAYRGDLLEGCYDDWVLPERERLHVMAMAVLAALMDEASRRGDPSRAVQLGDRLLRLDPLDESTYRRLMEAHVAAGERTRAVRRFHECTAVLDRELGLAPDAATVGLYETIVVNAAGSSGVQFATGQPMERSPLIGREHDVERLRAAWRTSAVGRSQFVMVTGEPGIGKSRLVEDFLGWCAHERLTTVAARAYEAEGAVPYGPIVDVLRSEVLRASLEALDPRSRRQLARLLPAMIDGRPAADQPGGGERQQLFEAIGRALIASGRPLVLAIDDVQWCDGDSLELLEFVVRFGRQSASPLLVVGMARAEEVASQPRLRALIGRLHMMDAMVELPLGRLNAADAALLVNGLRVGAKATPVEVDRLVEAAEGSPLFLVELARSGHADPPGGGFDELPPRIQAVIESRLDQLGPPAREMAAVAAVVGRAFTVDIVGELLTTRQDTVAAIDELWRRGIVREHGLDGYDFSHDKIREVAYRTIGPARRRHLHGAVAAALDAAGEPGNAAQVASHLERAGQVDAAIAAYHRAVIHAAAVFAHHDVITSCRRGLQLVATRTPGRQRDEAELEFLMPLGVALHAGPGQAEADAAVYERARRLRVKRGRAPEPSTLRLSANAAIVQRDFHQARAFGHTLLSRGLDDGDAIVITEGHYLVGVTSFWLGELETSRHHLEAALASTRPSHTPVHLERFGQDPRSVCLVRLALTRFHLGDVADADRTCASVLDAAAETDHLFTEVYVRSFAAWYLAESGDAERAASVVDGMPTGAITNSIAPVTRALYAGWAHTVRGDPMAGIELLEQAHDEARRQNQLIYEPFVLLTLAQAHSSAGNAAASLTAAISARKIAADEMPFHLAEATRVNGDLLLTTGGNPAESIALLDEAARIARNQGSVVYEIRARTSLLRAVRRHVPASIPARAEALRVLCDRLPGPGRLMDIDAARRELAIS